MKTPLLGRSLLAASLCTILSTADAGSSQKKYGSAINTQSEHSYYLGGSVGTSTANDFCLADEKCNDDAKSWKAYGGYQLTEMLTLEGGYANLGELGRQADGEDADATKISGITGSLLASFPVQEKINIFGKAGFFKHKTDDDNASYTDDIKTTYGIGADYEIAEGIAIRGEWENYKDIQSENNTETSDIQMLSIGMTFSSL